MTGSRTVTVAANTLTIGGVISGTSATAGLTKAGPGTLLLLGDNTYTGATHHCSGLLQLGDGGTTGSLASTSILNNGRIVVNRAGQAAPSEPTSVESAACERWQWHASAHRNNTYTEAPPFKMGSSFWEVHQPLVPELSPSTSIVPSILAVRPSRLSPGSEPTTNSHITTSSSGSSSLIINNSATNILDGDIRQDGGVISLVKSGSGSLNITRINSYTGGTTLNAGTLNIGNTFALGVGPLTIGGISIIDNISGAALSLDSVSKQSWNADFTFKGSDSLNLGSSPVSLNASRTVTVAANTLTVAGVISAARGATAGLTKGGAGTLILTGSNTYTGATTIASGLLQLGDGGASGSLASASILNNGRLAINRAGQLALEADNQRNRSLLKDGNGTLLLSGKNTYTGGTTIQNRDARFG